MVDVVGAQGVTQQSWKSLPELYDTGIEKKEFLERRSYVLSMIVFLENHKQSKQVYQCLFDQIL